MNDMTDTEKRTDSPGHGLLAETVQAFKTGLRGEEYEPGSGGSPALKTEEELRALVDESMIRNKIPGAIVGIAHGNEDLIACFGVTNVENPLPITPETLFQIGSTTKTITGTAVMRLVDEGKIDLDAPVRTYLSDFKVADDEAAAHVTVRHLLTHTAGWEGDFFVDPSLYRGDDALQQVVALMADRPQLSPIGEIWAYNNAAFYVAGRIIEVVTGKVYEAAIKELILDPLKLEHSFFFPEEVMTYRFVSGHQVENNEVKVARGWALPRSAHAAGGIVATTADVLHYARFHVGNGTALDGTRLLSPQSIALMQTPYATADNGSHIGLTWFIKDIGGLRTVSHGGTTNGQYSEFLMVPEKQFAISVIANGGHRHALGYEVVAWALRHYLGVQEEAPRPLAAEHEDFVPLIGRYDGAGAYLELQIGESGPTIQAVPTRGSLGDAEPPAPPPPTRIAMLEGDRLLLLDPPYKDVQAEILRDATGAVQWLRLSKRIWRRQELA